MIFKKITCQRTLFGFCKSKLKLLQDLMTQIREKKYLFALDYIFIGCYKATYMPLSYIYLTNFPDL